MPLSRATSRWTLSRKVGQSNEVPSTRPAKAFGVGEFFREMAGIDEEFLRHAAADDASAADPVLFGDRDARARARRHARRAHAAGTAADHEQIIVEWQSSLHSAGPGSSLSLI